MTLVSLLSEAGGISQTGAALVRVIGSEAQEDTVERDAPPLQTDTVLETETASSPQTDTMLETVVAPPKTTTVKKRAVTIRSSVSGPSIHIEASPSTAEQSQEGGDPSPSPDEAIKSSAMAPTVSDTDRPGDPCRPDPGPIVSDETLVSDKTPDSEERAKNHTVVLPVVGMNIPFKDIALTEGDTVVVEPIQMPTMSVLGLVQNPGNFAYPPYARYNLTQAIALAGGLAMDVDPRYVTVYRPGPNESVRSLTFRLIEDGSYTENLNEPIRPGDLIAVEHTPRTRTNDFINRFLRFSIGTWVDVSELWE